MKSIFLSFFGLSLIICTSAFMPSTAKKGQVATYEGYLVDRMCSSEIIDKGTAAYAAAAAHTKTCLIEPQCVKSGFGIVTPQNKWIPFDQVGSAKAGQLAVLTARADHIDVVAKGLMKNGVLEVTSVEESKN